VRGEAGVGLMAEEMMRSRLRRMVVMAALLGATGCGSDCDDLKREARELKDDYAACSSGDTCVVVDMYSLAGANNCLAAFQCSAALREGTDLDAFGSKARAIASDFEGCSECSMAGCVDPSQLRAECNTAEGRCVLVP